MGHLLKSTIGAIIVAACNTTSGVRSKDSSVNAHQLANPPASSSVNVSEDSVEGQNFTDGATPMADTPAAYDGGTGVAIRTVSPMADAPAAYETSTADEKNIVPAADSPAAYDSTGNVERTVAPMADSPAAYESGVGVNDRTVKGR